MLFCYFIFESKRPSPSEADGGVKAAGVEPAPRDWPLWNGKNGMCWIDLDRFGSIWIDDQYPLPLLEGFSDLLAFAPRSHWFLFLVGRTFSFHV